MKPLLSRRIRVHSRKYLFRYSFFNGIAANITIGNTIFLLALFYGASDFQMGLLYAAVHITGLSSFFAPNLLNGRDASSVFSGFWWLRSFFNVCYLLLPFVASDSLKVWVLIVLYYLFMSARVFGMVAYFPVLKALCSTKELPSVNAKLFSIISYCSIFTMIFMYTCFELNPFGNEEWVFVFLLGVGFLGNASSARCLSCLPSTGVLREDSSTGLFAKIPFYMKIQASREVLMLTFLQTCIFICIPYSISYLRNIGDYSNVQIFLITLAGTLGGSFIAFGLRVIGARIPSRILLFGVHFLLASMGLTWAMIDHIPLEGSGKYGFCLFVHVMTTIGSFGSATVLFQIQTARLPKENSMEQSILYQLFAVAAAAFAIGAIETLSLIEISSIPILSHSYSTTFLFLSGLATSICVYSFFMKSFGKSDFVEELSLLMPSNLMSIFRVFQLERKGLSRDKLHVMEGMLLGTTQTSKSLMSTYLSSSDMLKRYSAFRSVNNNPSKEYYPMVMSEAKSKDSPMRVEAITSLGMLEEPKAIEHLRGFLNEPIAAIKASSVKSILRLGGNVEASRIIDIYNGCMFTRDRLHIILGLMDRKYREVYFQILGAELQNRVDDYWVRTLFHYLAETYEKRETMVEIFDEESKGKGLGLVSLIDTLDVALPERLSANVIEDLLEKENYSEFATRLKEIMGGAWINPYSRYSSLGVLYIWILEAEKKDLLEKI